MTEDNKPPWTRREVLIAGPVSVASVAVVPHAYEEWSHDGGGGARGTDGGCGYGQAEYGGGGYGTLDCI